MSFAATLAFASMLIAPVQQGQQPPPAQQGTTQTTPQAPAVRKVAIIPWSMKDGVEEARKVCSETVDNLFKGVNYEPQSPTLVKTTWEETLGQAKLKDTYDGSDNLPSLPTAKDLLALGETLKVDLVCAGRAKWHTKSVWVSLGPKTKADCTVDIMIVDVLNKEVVLEAHDVKADSTRTEKGLETAASLLISFGFTAFSGGPKTPHQKRAGQLAVMLAMDPWLKTEAQRRKKIGG
jgi:hypothetical protein